MTNDYRCIKENFIIWRVFAWAGPLYLGGLLIFWGLVAGYIPAPAQYWSAQEITQFFLDNNIRIRTGMVGTMFIAPFYYLWSLVICSLMRRIEGQNGLLSQVEFVGGIATAFVTLVFGWMFLTASFRTELRSPEDIQLLSDLGWLFFDMTIMVTLLQMCAFGTALLLDKREVKLFPTWLAWFTYGVAATFLTAYLMPFFVSGPFAWHGLVTYWVVLSGFFIWMLLTCYYIFPAIKKVEQEDGQLYR